MKAILVDNDQNSVSDLTKILTESGKIEIIGACPDPISAIEMICRRKPDLVMTEVDLPTMNGLEMAKKLQECAPETQVVIVASTDKYAVSAFELPVADYIIKPLQPERLTKTLLRINNRHDARRDVHTNETTAGRIRLFGKFQIEDHTGKSVRISYRTRKVQELFAFLLHKNGQFVRKETLIELLWPKADQNKSYTNLYTTVYQLRQSLRYAELDIAINSNHEGYYLDIGGFRIDAEEWESGQLQEQEVWKSGIQPHQELLKLYRGEYLEDLDYDWAKNRRHELSMKWFYHAIAVGDYLLAAGGHTEAIGLGQILCERYPYNWQGYLVLMRAYAGLGELLAVEQHYQKYLEAISSQNQRALEMKIVRWYKNWIEKSI